MKTSLTEVRQIERYLHGSMDAGERIIFEAQLLAIPEFRGKVNAQGLAYSLIRKYGRKKLRMSLEEIHAHLFADQSTGSFRQRILSLFS